jgi:hypothetical protein
VAAAEPQAPPPVKTPATTPRWQQCSVKHRAIAAWAWCLACDTGATCGEWRGDICPSALMHAACGRRVSDSTLGTLSAVSTDERPARCPPRAAVFVPATRASRSEKVRSHNQRQICQRSNQQRTTLHLEALRRQPEVPADRHRQTHQRRRCDGKEDPNPHPVVAVLGGGVSACSAAQRDTPAPC